MKPNNPWLKDRFSLLPAVYLMAGLLGLSFWQFPVGDPDLGWQLLGGDWILSHHQVPSADFINAFVDSWRDYHWLAQVFISWTYSIGGFSLLRIVFGIILAAQCLLIVDIIRISIGRSGSTLLYLLLVLSSQALLLSVSSIRPQSISILLLTVALRILLSDINRIELPGLFVISVLLANIHVNWIFVPCLWICYRIMPYFIRGTIGAAYVFGGLALLILAGAISPYGFANFQVVVDYLYMPSFLLNSISELQNPLSLRGQLPIIYAFYLIVIARLIEPKRALLDSGSTLLAVITPFLALRSAKFLGLFSVLTLPFLARYLHRALRIHTPRLLRSEAIAAKILVTALILALTFSVVRGFPANQANRSELFLDKTYPIELCAQIPKLGLKPNSGKKHILILTHFNYGAWCLWSLAQGGGGDLYRISSDGRTQDIDPAAIKKTLDLYSLQEGWQTTLNEWSPVVVVSAKSHPLSQALSLMSGWKVAGESEKYTLFTQN